MTPKLERKPLAWFKRNPNQPRKEFTEDDLRRLGKSLRVRQLQPVVARSSGELLAGERRLRAAEFEGLETLLAIVTDDELSESQILQVALVENMQRADLSAHEQWVASSELMCRNNSWQMKDLADALHLTPSQVTRLLSPSKCIEAVQDALRDGKIGISAVYTISKQPHSKQAGLLALKLSGATRDELETERRKGGTEARQGGGRPPPEKCERVRIPLAVATKELKATGTVTVASSPGAPISLQEAENLLREALKAVREAQGRGLGLKAAQAAWRDMATPKPKPA